MNFSLGTYLGAALALAFSVWWVLFPESVIPFYNWLGRRPVRPVKPAAIRLLGILWAVIVVVVLFS